MQGLNLAPVVDPCKAVSADSRGSLRVEKDPIKGKPANAQGMPNNAAGAVMLTFLAILGLSSWPLRGRICTADKGPPLAGGGGSNGRQIRKCPGHAEWGAQQAGAGHQLPPGGHRYSPAEVHSAAWWPGGFALCHHLWGRGCALTPGFSWLHLPVDLLCLGVHSTLSHHALAVQQVGAGMDIAVSTS